MKKTLKAIAVGTLLLSGLSFSHDAEAKTVKETRLNYLDKKVVKKVKAGKITSLDGFKLGTTLKTVKKNKDLSYHFILGEYRLNTNTLYITPSNNKAFVDLCDYECTANDVITRLEDTVLFDKNSEDLTRPRLLKLYGTPSKSNQQYIKGNTTYRLDYYKFGVFVYHKNNFNNTYYLESVQYLGKEFKTHPDRFKRLAKKSIQEHTSSHIINEPFYLEDWKSI